MTSLAESFRDGLRRVLGAKLVGAYIYGAAAFPDDAPTGDVDFHVIVEDELTAGERTALDELHKALARQFPPLGAGMDGYYILLDDARRTSPPQSQMWRRATDNAWALHREHIRAGRHIVLHGPDPKTIYPPATWDEIEAALWGEMAFVESHLEAHPDYCILNLCRLIYSFATGDVVVSKAAAAEWAWTHLPAWRRHVELARKSYAGEATEEEMAFMVSEVGGFFEFARERIEQGHGC